MFLVNTTGWVTFADVFPEYVSKIFSGSLVFGDANNKYCSNQHPNVAGHVKIAGLFQAWLENWGLKPQALWAD